MRCVLHLPVSCVLAACIGLVLLFAGCASEQPAFAPLDSPTKIGLAMLEPGVVVLTASAEMPAISYDPPNNKMESAGEGAAAAADQS